MTSWVKYGNMGGPRHLGERDGKKFAHEYVDHSSTGPWGKILGVIAASEGRYDTVVMYDGTGVTFGAFQWTFTSGRLQKFLTYLQSVQSMEFEQAKQDVVLTDHGNLFDIFMDGDGDRQVFEDFGFYINGGQFWSSGKVLNPRNPKQKKRIVQICMGDSRRHAMALCNIFADAGRDIGIQFAQNEYAKLELKQALIVNRPPLKSVGGKIWCLLPQETWNGPIPAIFFNLYQNLPGGSFKLFKRIMKKAEEKDLVSFCPNNGYGNVKSTDDLLDLVWRELCQTQIADWGFKSRKYLQNNKNTPRVTRIRPAILKYYGLKLPYIK